MKKICLSGAITGHEKEAQVYFMEAERRVLEIYPDAVIFNPVKIPFQKSWKDYMDICIDRLQTWANMIAIIKNEHLEASAGAMIEKHIAFESELDVLYVQLETGGIS